MPSPSPFWVPVAAILLLGAAAAEEPVRPKMTTGDPAPGKFVKQVAEEYKGTNVHHALYLPSNWQRGKTYPVIVEYAPNRWEKFSGRVEDCRLGFYQSGGKDFLWVVMPYIDSAGKDNQVTWWGDEEATARYCRTNLRRICEKFGGDPNAVFITGFSRGAIACGYLGLRDETMADIWLGFLPHSHIDGGRFTVKGAKERLARVRGRATFVSYGSLDSGRMESPKGAKILRELSFPVVEREIGATGHTDAWIEKDCPERREMRAWLADVLKKRPGTFSVTGRVTDAGGKGIAGVRVQCGGWHWAVTRADGTYTIESLVPGKRVLNASRRGWRFTPARQEITLTAENVKAEPLRGEAGGDS